MITVSPSATRATMSDESGCGAESSGDRLNVMMASGEICGVTLSLSPILKSPVSIDSDMLARVADGETLVLSGFTRDREVRERKTVGISGGWFGRGTVVTHKRVELVILLTPKIVTGVAVQ